MRLRHAESLGAAIAADHAASRGATACHALARFVIDAYALARGSTRPEATVDEVFVMIAAGWDAAPQPAVRELVDDGPTGGYFEDAGVIPW